MAALTRPSCRESSTGLVRALVLALACAAGAAQATSDPLADVVEPDGAGAGMLSRIEQSPYRGIGSRQDLMPLYVYEGQYAYLRSYRVGLKLDTGPWRFDLFLKRRFEGTPYDLTPDELPGITRREQQADVGLGLQWRRERHLAYVELVRDATAVSHGAELRVGLRDEIGSGRLRLRPHLMFGWRDAALNNYYYGVSPAEAAPGRPAHAPGSGPEVELDLYAIYRMTGAWYAIGGVTATRRSSGVRSSPIVEDDRMQVGALLGVLYDFSPQTREWPEGRPSYARVFYGASSDCDMMEIVRLACTSTHTQDTTSVAGYEIGRPLVQRLNGWPLDIAAFVGLVRHKERGTQPDFWQVNGYLKLYYYGLPWSHLVNTRLGFGAGLSYSRRVPFMEQRDQALRGRDTSRLLNYMDPTIDFSLGDLLRVRGLRDTYLGLGVSHRSGIFGSSQLLGNVDGGSNYIYSYIEAAF
jgi:outer membrane protein